MTEVKLNKDISLVVFIFFEAAEPVFLNLTIMEFCPECGIGLSNAQKVVGYCNNCHCDFNDELMKEKKEWDGLCRCGHKHSEHGKTQSINYTAGRCAVSGCNCRNFLMPKILNKNIVDMKENEFIKEHKQYGDIELLDSESSKLKGMPFPGATVNIFWKDWAKDMFDVGYLFLLPFSDKDIDDYFIHIPNPENPGGKDTAEPEWVHINKLLKNEYCKEIRIVSNSN